MCMVLRFLSGVVLAGLLAWPATCEEARQPALIYSPWTKICLEGICFIGREIRSDCGVVVAAGLIEKAGEAKKTLRIIVRVQVSPEHGVRIIIDRSQPVTRPFDACFPNGCIAEYEGGAALVEQLKQGQMLILEWVDAANLPVNRSVSLVDFAKAYDGPPHETRVQEELVVKREGMQDWQERQKREEAARKLRCEGATPIP
jgi:invasion protein IalB